MSGITTSGGGASGGGTSGRATTAKVPVTVVGGGLAGMTAALTIRQLGLPVRLLEAGAELGGQATARTINGRTEDHGVHIIPAWYRSTLELVDELGIGDRLAETDNFYQLLPGEFPHFRSYGALFSFADFVKDIRSGVTPPADRLLFYYGLIDLLSQRYDRRDQSLREFLRSRWYLTRPAIDDIEHLFVASSAAEPDVASAASFRGSIAGFSSDPGRVLMPRADLEQTLIGPFRRRLEADGVEVRTGVELVGATVADGRLATLTLRDAALPDGERTVTEEVTGHVVLAVPHGVLTGLGPDVTSALRPKYGAEELRSRPLGALHLHLRRRLPGMPDEHVRLVGSPHAITLLDVGQVWEGHTTTVLNCVVGRTARLADLSDDEAVKVIVAELMTYIPALSLDDIEHVCYQPHFDTPFYAPAPGSDRHRPENSTSLPNLHLAGDFCAAPPGIAGMEGAVRSGRAAAESVRRALRPTMPVIPVQDIGTVDPRSARAAKYALAPLAVGVRFLAARANRRRARTTTPGVTRRP
ncbi:hydroxysqualene dehydroxylase [Streptomyces alkaliterrae]|uniref:FAD-dependent oxidoreductase n=1 Tax=Streptomyces alkaliterrae TaxID=2213162 RepID=A0A5P0YY86_9ACTN|nr:FAD-dependent oxidoreductase [Streptomyces alkaliterrae]MBB1261645.1 FAD-dependent oxidoreductase [Streptomyces alkaliterrae]MQS04507.1 NAD(P)-binding protein [Streptomyces alkaliterrae]